MGELVAWWLGSGVRVGGPCAWGVRQKERESECCTARASGSALAPTSAPEKRREKKIEARDEGGCCLQGYLQEL